MTAWVASLSVGIAYNLIEANEAQASVSTPYAAQTRYETEWARCVREECVNTTFDADYYSEMSRLTATDFDAAVARRNMYRSSAETFQTVLVWVTPLLALLLAVSSFLFWPRPKTH